MYTLPLWDINLAANAQYRQGYPYPRRFGDQPRQRPRQRQRPGRADGRAPSRRTVHSRPARRRAFSFGRMRLMPSIDVFNATNANTEQSRRRIMGSYNHRHGRADAAVEREQHLEHHRSENHSLRRPRDLVNQQISRSADLKSTDQQIDNQQMGGRGVKPPPSLFL